MGCIFKCVIFIMCCSPITIAADEDSSTESYKEAKVPIQKKILSLLANYNMDEEPTKYDYCSLAVHVRHLHIDDTSGTATLLGTLQLSWTDERLMFNESDMNGAKSLVIDAEMLWKPKILLQNSATQIKIGGEESSVVAFANGSVYWLPRVSLPVPCALDFDIRPLDHNTCSFVFLTNSGARNNEVLPTTFNFTTSAEEDKTYGIWKVIDSYGEKYQELVFSYVNITCTKWIVKVKRMELAKEMIGRAAATSFFIMFLSTLLLESSSRTVVCSVITLGSTYIACASVLRSQNGTGTPRLIFIFASIMIISSVSLVLEGFLHKLSGSKKRLPEILERFVGFWIRNSNNTERHLVGTWSNFTALLANIIIVILLVVMFIILLVLW